MLGAVAVVAMTFGFWALSPDEPMAIVPWALITLLLAIVLTTLALMVRGFRR
ncbi:hypothetical protein I41_37660 [Lacipirellula limnantheis]|uniref:Uncharacterized protein n=1 Tax=Lacipirellula limnantheis TaxID=2528024 RepID=A0A517U1Q4_9BACT|nr:hypothetical protein I41_37660 [Lacipirellula limnantheis]